MRKLIAILAVALAIPTMSFAKGEGRYQAIQLRLADSIKDRASYLILDTKTGMMKICSSAILPYTKITCGEEDDGK